MKTIYSGYYDRLFELSKKNKCIFMERLPKKDFSDLSLCAEAEFFLSQKNDSFPAPFKFDDGVTYYVGYPYFFYKKKDVEIKAPVLFYPVRQEEGRVFFDGKPLFNRSLFLILGGKKRRNELFIRYSERNKTNIETFLSDMKESGFSFKTKKLLPLLSFSAPSATKVATVVPIAVLGKFEVLSLMQEDYFFMQKNNLKNSAIEELLSGKEIKNSTKKERTFFTEETDYSQEQAIKESGRNIVLHGPPGTGKSQTIAAIVGNESCHQRNTLVVSQKKVALKVISDRLQWYDGGILHLEDEEDKVSFFQALNKAHSYALRPQKSNLSSLNKIQSEIEKLSDIVSKADEKLYAVTSYGLPLQKMYEAAFVRSASEQDERLYNDFLSTELVSLGHEELTTAIETIKNSKLMDKFIEYNKILTDNPLAGYTVDVGIEVLQEVKRSLRQRYIPFPYEKIGFSRYILPFIIDGIHAKKLPKYLLQITDRNLFRWHCVSCFPLFWFIFPFVHTKYSMKLNHYKNLTNECINKYREYIRPLLPLQNFLDKEGFHYVVEGIANGASDRLKTVEKTIDNYLRIRELKALFGDLSPIVKSILCYCYDHSDNNIDEMNAALKKIIPIRICHELLKLEPTVEKKLLSMGNLKEIRQQLCQLKKERVILTREYAREKCKIKFLDYCKTHPEKYKNFVFRINNPSWSVKKTVSVFYEFIIRLYPCILASPAAASAFPLKKNLFDKVIFDEASQLPVENAVPALYRAKTVVIAGDDKQLSPSCAFSKRIETDEQAAELSDQDALDAHSLLDLASVKYFTFPLVYHYRSRHSALIDFSNKIFYRGRLVVAPDVSYGQKPPIEWIKVNGKKVERKNKQEAVAVLKLIENNIDNGSIGVITFNVEQMTLIQEYLNKKLSQHAEWKDKWKGFVKNIENIQGEETDIVIFSTCFAPDENNKIFARYGFLGTEGGERRLNVAITRAKNKIYVVTSIDPDKLPVESVKHVGPKILKEYLSYAKSVSDYTLNSPDFFTNELALSEFEKQLKKRLEQIGYTIYSNVKSSGFCLSMAIWDEKEKKFLLGLECDARSYKGGGTALERDISRPAFLEQKGWNILRVWARDWWLSPQKVITEICNQAETLRRNSSLRFDLASASLPVRREKSQNITVKIGK